MRSFAETVRVHVPMSSGGGVAAPIVQKILKESLALEAGYNLAVSAWRDGQQFVMIVLGSRTRTASFLDAKKLLKYGFVEAGLETPPEPRPEPRPTKRARRTSTVTQ